jgi:hypothetical protein
MTAGPAALPERPPVSSPDRPRESSWIVTSQPRLGLIGLVLVVPIAAVLAVGAGGPERSALILGPLVTYALPLVAVVAFWWEDWPGTRLRAGLSGWADTVVIALGALVLTAIAQSLAGGLDPVGLFDATPGAGHVPTFPATLPLAGTAFVVMLELILVGEGWPLHRLPRIPAGLIALAVSCAVATLVYVTVVDIRPPAGSRVIARDGPVTGEHLGTVLVLIGAAQVLVYVLWQGRPFAAITSRRTRLACAHVAVIGAGVVTFIVVHVAFGVAAVTITAAAGCFVAACLVLGMQFEGLHLGGLGPAAMRVVLTLAAGALTVALVATLRGFAGGLRLQRVTADQWVVHASLNALAVSIILHVAVGRRWPFRSATGAALVNDSAGPDLSPVGEGAGQLAS